MYDIVAFFVVLGARTFAATYDPINWFMMVMAGYFGLRQRSVLLVVLLVVLFSAYHIAVVWQRWQTIGTATVGYAAWVPATKAILGVVAYGIGRGLIWLFNRLRSAA